MKKKSENYRIISEEGEILLITSERYQNLLATLDVLANGTDNQSQQQRYRKKS